MAVVSDMRGASKAVVERFRSDHIPLLASGVAFWGMLAIFPAMIALLTIYGLVADPQRASSQARELLGNVSPEMQQVLTRQVEAIAGTESTALTVGFLVSLALVLWSASSGLANLIKALTVAFGRQETRGFVKRRGIALAATLGAIIVAGLAVAVIGIIPAVIERALGQGGILEWIIRGGRWIAFGLVVAVALAALYRFTPDRERPSERWITPGAAAATLLWVGLSFAFSVYVQNLGNYGNTYGAIAGVIILMLWLYLTSLAILIGAVIDSTVASGSTDASMTQRPPARAQPRAS